MPSALIRPDGLVDHSPSLRILSHYAGEQSARPEADVLRGNPISICFETTFTSEIVVLCRFFSLTTSRTRLRSVFWIDSNHFNSFLQSLILQSKPEKTIRNSVDFLPPFFVDFSFPCSEMFNILYHYGCIIFLSEFDYFAYYLPDSCFDIIPLLSAEHSEFSSCFTVEEFVSIVLEFCPSLFISDLLQRYILSKIELLQPSFSSRVIHADCQPACIYVNSEKIRHYFWFWKLFFESSIEFQIFSHDYRAKFPTLLNVFKQSFISTILLNRYGNSFRINSQTQNRIFTFSFLEGKQPFIESNNNLIYFSLLSYIPSISLCLNNQLRSDIVFFSERTINKFLNIFSREIRIILLDFENLQNHLIESLVTLKQKFLFTFGWFKQINTQTLAPQHSYISEKQTFKHYRNSSPPLRTEPPCGD